MVISKKLSPKRLSPKCLVAQTSVHPLFTAYRNITFDSKTLLLKLCPTARCVRVPPAWKVEKNMNIKLDLMLLMLAVAIGVIIPVMSRLNSVQVISYKAPRNVQNGPPLCALDVANETSSSSEQDCSLKCARDATCTGYNIKNSLTCDHINTPVLATT